MGKGGSSRWLELVRLANKKTRNSRLLRRAGILGYTTAVRANVFLPPPRVLLNGPGKSGTHLLSDCLSLMPRMMFSGRHFALPDFFSDASAYAAGPSGVWPSLQTARLEKLLRRCPRGMFVTAHARFHPEFSEMVDGLGFKHVLLLRDPRDIAVSHSFYMLQDTLHQHHDHYARTLRSDEERLMASIRGFQKSEVAGPLPPIGGSFGAYLPWLDEPSTLVVRFEDMIGSHGGGGEERQLEEIERIAGFVERPLSREQSSEIARKMYGKGSLTFRKGRAGDWRNHFTEAHKRAFKETAGDLLVKLGYEEDLNW